MCDFVEVDDKRTPIYRNDLLTVTREQAGVTTDLANDMTLVSALPFASLSIRGDVLMNFGSHITVC